MNKKELMGKIGKLVDEYIAGVDYRHTCQLQWSDVDEKWIAILKDPCPECSHPSCRNAGRPFAEPKRLIIR